MTGGTASRRRTVRVSSSSALLSGRRWPGRSCSSSSDSRPRRPPVSPEPPGVNPPPRGRTAVPWSAYNTVGTGHAPPCGSCGALCGLVSHDTGLTGARRRRGSARRRPLSLRADDVPTGNSRSGVALAATGGALWRPSDDPVVTASRTRPGGRARTGTPAHGLPPVLGRPTMGLRVALVPPRPVPGPMGVVGLPTGPLPDWEPEVVPPFIGVGRPTGPGRPPPPVLVLALETGPGPLPWAQAGDRNEGRRRVQEDPS